MLAQLSQSAHMLASVELRALYAQASETEIPRRSVN